MFVTNKLLVIKNKLKGEINSMEFEIFDRNQVEIEPRKTKKQVEYETIKEAIKNGKVYMARADYTRNRMYVLLRKLCKDDIKATWAKDKKTGRIIVFQVE